ncbi:MAG: histidine kinase [Chitinophagaceae bacterium]|nr:MAG: histidine kinase [Chitinophagaceae bacterium]
MGRFRLLVCFWRPPATGLHTSLFYPIFTPIKRVLLHIAFWIFYLCFCFVNEYMWAEGQLPGYSTGKLMLGTTTVAILTSLPEMLFAYFMMYYGFDRFLLRKQLLQTLLVIFAVFVGCTVLSRLATFHVLKTVYDGRLAQDELFNALVISRAVIFMGFASGMSVSLKLLRTQLRAKQREQDLVKQKLGAELQLLRNQLHPHFLFNTLNNIYALARRKSDLAPEAILKLSELLSFMLYESREKLIPIRNEIGFLEDYIALEKIRYDERLKISFRQDVEDPAREIGSLLLLPLVENAFKHGAGETRFDSFINMELEQSGSLFRFCIENRYEAAPAMGKPDRIGLPNIRRQLELLYRDHDLQVQDSGGIFRVSLRLNLDSYGEN